MEIILVYCSVPQLVLYNPSLGSVMCKYVFGNICDYNLPSLPISVYLIY